MTPYFQDRQARPRASTRVGRNVSQQCQCHEALHPSDRGGPLLRADGALHGSGGGPCGVVRSRARRHQVPVEANAENDRQRWPDDCRRSSSGPNSGEARMELGSRPPTCPAFRDRSAINNRAPCLSADSRNPPHFAQRHIAGGASGAGGGHHAGQHAGNRAGEGLASGDGGER